MKPGKVVLLVGILAAGATIETADRIRARVDVGPFGWVALGGRFQGAAFTYEATEKKDVPAGTRAAVENGFGTVDVRPGAPGVIEVKLRKVVFMPKEAKAREFADRLVVRSELAGGVLRVTTNRAELEREVEPIGPFRFGSIGFETHLSVRVPPGTEVEVKNEHGIVDVAEVASARIESSYDDVKLRDVAGTANVSVSHGDATIDKITGELQISARYGDVTLADASAGVKINQAHGDVTTARTGRLSLETQYGDLSSEDVRGDLQVRGEHSAVTASRIQGGADVETSYDDVKLTDVGADARVKVEHGGATLSGIKGAATAETSYNDVDIEQVGGAVTASVAHGSVRASRIAAGARVKADGDDILLDGFRGPVEAEAQRGSVRLVPDGPLVGSLSARATYGDVQLQVPPGSRFELQATTDSGSLDVTLPGLTTSESSETRLVGRLGEGGSLVQLSASHGDVRISPRSEVANR